MVTTLPELLEAFRSRLRSQLQQVQGAHVHRKLGSLADAPAQQQRRGVALWVPSTIAGTSGNRDTEQVFDSLQVEVSYNLGINQADEKGALDFEQLVHATLMDWWAGKPCNLVEFEDVQREVVGSLLFSTATFRVTRFRSRMVG